MEFNITIEIPAETVQELKRCAEKKFCREVTTEELQKFIESDCNAIYIDSFR